MNSRSPWLSLILLGVLALALGVGGARLARRFEQVRVDRDGAPLRAFEETLQGELLRLESLYERHALRIAQETPMGDPRQTREACAWLVGLRQFSLIRPLTPGQNDFHAPVDARLGETLPEPAFVRGADSGLPRKRIILFSAELLRGEVDHGWISQPGQTLLFWYRRDPQNAVVLLLDATAIRAAMNGWLEKWCTGEFTPVSVAGGPDALLAPDDTPLASIGEVNSTPNMLLPLRTRFGTWRLASWDRFTVRESYHLPMLLGGIGAALLVALLAAMVFVQQRSALRLAAQRVSFVNSVSHELRTPLTNMLLNLDLAAEHVPESSAGRLALVREEAGRLGRLIENVLTFSRGEQGKLSLRAHACKPADVLDSVLAQFAPSFERRQITVRREGNDTTCVLDADALAQVAANLLSNVEKYAPGCDVTVFARCEGERLTMRVADTGSGIPAHAADRVFEPFERLDSRVNEGASGTGLGLAIARDLATRMGGTLRLVPSERGATFELSVPAPSVPEIRSVDAA